KLTADRVAYFCHPDWVVDAARATPSELWQPHIDTEAGLRDTAAWYRGQRWLCSAAVRPHSIAKAPLQP
ncbi:MAG: hypothetical protein ABR588_11435, partial [Sphingomicrobium sp.]